MRFATAHHNVPGSWREISWGENFRDALTQHLQPCLSKLYGFHLLKVGPLSAEIDTGACPISHQVSAGLHGENLQVMTDPERLSFESNSIDACLLAHTLVWSQNPHGILREVDRVLVDDGWMIISGFNPLSLLAPGKIIPGLRRYAPWNGHMFSQLRLLDWLSLLNYEVVQRSRCQVIPWSRQGGKLISTHMPVFGCINIIVARKRTVPLTMTPAIKPLSKIKLPQTVNATRQLQKLKDQDSG